MAISTATLPEMEYPPAYMEHAKRVTAYIDDDEGDNEDDDDDQSLTNESVNGKVDTDTLNGSTNSRSADRYGFVGGGQYTDPNLEERIPVNVIRRREMKWLEMLENWEKWMSKKFSKVKERCRKGIPPSLRSRAWQYLCGSKFLMEHNKGRFEAYLKQSGDPRWIDDIRKDLHRQFPFHEMFESQDGSGQEDLFRVLKAYTIHSPKEGYCQAQGPIAALLLMHMPAEQAFWCLVSICEKYLPGYYSPGLEAVQVDGDVLFGLLKKVSRPTYNHLKKFKVEPILYMTEWFLCIFSRTLPWGTVLRLWDMFFCEGVKVMFRVALCLFKQVLSTKEQLNDSQGLYEIMECLRNIPPRVTSEMLLIDECNKISLSDREMAKEHQIQLAKRQNSDSLKKRKTDFSDS